MANVVYTQAKVELDSGTIHYLTDTLKVMLVNATYTPNPEDLVVDAGGANDPVDAEISAAGYVGGWGGSGRLALAGRSISADTVGHRSLFHANNLSWASIASGPTIAGAILIKEGVANDTTSRLIAYFDLTDTPTAGGEVDINWDAAGVLAR